MTNRSKVVVDRGPLACRSIAAYPMLHRPGPIPSHRLATPDQSNASREWSYSVRFGRTARSAGPLWIAVTMPARRFYGTGAQRSAHVGHDAFGQPVVGRAVVDDRPHSPTEKVGVDTSVHRPDRVDLAGELRVQKAPCDGFDLLPGQSSAAGCAHHVPFSARRSRLSRSYRFCRLCPANRDESPIGRSRLYRSQIASAGNGPGVLSPLVRVRSALSASVPARRGSKACPTTP